MKTIYLLLIVIICLSTSCDERGEVRILPGYVPENENIHTVYYPADGKDLAFESIKVVIYGMEIDATVVSKKQLVGRTSSPDEPSDLKKIDVKVSYYVNKKSYVIE